MEQVLEVETSHVLEELWFIVEQEPWWVSQSALHIHWSHGHAAAGVRVRGHQQEPLVCPGQPAALGESNARRYECNCNKDPILRDSELVLCKYWWLHQTVLPGCSGPVF